MTRTLAPDAVAAVPVAPALREIPAELTPLRALAAVESQPGTLFLETGGPLEEEREWTFLAFDPAWRLVLSDGVLRRIDPGPSGSVNRPLAGPPLHALRQAWPAKVALDPDPGIPFAGGLAGCLSYDFKDALHPYPRRARRESDLPDLLLGYYDVVWAWERRSGGGWVIATGPPGEEGGSRAAAARERLAAQWERVAGRGVALGPAPGGEDARAVGRARRLGAAHASASRIVSNFTRASYREAVLRALEHIAAGDIYQVNLAQRFLVTPSPSPAALHRSLREAAPAPFSAYLALTAGGIVSSSPERFFLVRGDRIETWPIKGTRPRGRTSAEDAALVAELRSSGKDRAENVMIVDLERNDLGRVCAIGSVAVPALCEVESFSNVHHLVSRVTGTLRPDAMPVDVLSALFPGGSITGTPKIRAVGIIDELEPVRRGIFTGAIGYWDARGDCDWNIAIRTLSVERGAASFHVGGGIVAESDPDAEYEETLAKAAGMMAALGVRWEG